MTRIDKTTSHCTSGRPDGTELAVLREVTAAAAEIFTERPRRAAALTYLRQRGIDPTAIPEQWPLGYAPSGWTRLVDALVGQFTDGALLAAGVARRSSRGTLIDTFRDRVMFPIHAADGQVAGFTGRDLSGAPDAPKYLNSARSPLFDKSALLYGLWEGQQTDAVARHVVVVEGPLDVLAITAHGSAASRPEIWPVAASGTAFTITHARMIAARASGQPVVIAVDGNAAGCSAASTAGELLRRAGVDARIAILPNGADPVDLLTGEGGLEMLSAAAALPLLTVHVERAVAAQRDRMQWIQGRLAAGRAIASYLPTFPADFAARQVSWICAYLAVDVATFTNELIDAYRAAMRPQPDRSATDTMPCHRRCL